MPRSRTLRKMGPRGRRALEAWRCPSGSGLACRPSLAGWPPPARLPDYLGARAASVAINPSMLLSFERPAPAGPREDMPHRRDHQGAETGRRSCLSTVLENCTEATSAAIDKRRLNNGYHRALCGRNISQRYLGHVGPDHRQDSKGTRWMPWHQESKKGVNGCDKPRLGA